MFYGIKVITRVILIISAISALFLQEELTNLKDIQNSLAIFCLATYGEGDPTDNAMEFYEWLQNGDLDFSGLNYAVRTHINPQTAYHISVTTGPALFLESPASG